ncbi:hypothetical protein, partial [Algoriphagus alkaliphilus]|uniref:hypothetical protein n=1 Tax=Algoriphagus alkaliphilus TaxID=279824 RepID=UPI001C316AEA
QGSGQWAVVNGPQSMVHSSGMFSWKFVLLLDSCLLIQQTTYCFNRKDAMGREGFFKFGFG